MSFWSKLIDSTDKTVSAHIFFIALALFAIIAYGFIHLLIEPTAFKISDFGVAIGSLLGGGGVYAGGSSRGGSRDAQ
jgi:hypothetical protein